MTFQRVPVSFAAMALLLSAMTTRGATDSRGIQFIPFRSFRTFEVSAGTNASATILTSPELHSRVHWDELIVSWNAHLPAGTGLTIESRAVYSGHTTKWYNLGHWSTDATKHPRESVKGQKDGDGNVDTDTLILERPTESVQVRVTLVRDGRRLPKLKFLSLSLMDSKSAREPLPPNPRAWGKVINVPQLSQMAYPNGDVLCSPTTLSMLLAYWSEQLDRPGIDGSVPDVVQQVHDPQWGGTGNWVFNTAYAGSFQGMRAYTTRLSDVSELEAFIANGIPVALSLCYNRLQAKSREPSGHLVVCVGFTEDGDVIVNDPGTSKNVRKTFPRANLIDAWAYSKNAVYLVYPVNTRLPEDRFGHWESPKAKRNVK